MNKEQRIAALYAAACAVEGIPEMHEISCMVQNVIDDNPDMLAGSPSQERFVRFMSESCLELAAHTEIYDESV